MRTHPISSDPRYTVQKEWCGYAEPRFVARFCGDWVGQSLSYPHAVLLATNHRMQRQGAAVIVGKPLPVS